MTCTDIPVNDLGGHGVRSEVRAGVEEGVVAVEAGLEYLAGRGLVADGRGDRPPGRDHVVPEDLLGVLGLRVDPHRGDSDQVAGDVAAMLPVATASVMPTATPARAAPQVRLPCRSSAIVALL